MITDRENTAGFAPTASTDKGTEPEPRVLFVTGSEGYPSGLSGYDRLMTGFPVATACGYDRRPSGWMRLAKPLARAVAGSQWALPATIWNELGVRRRLLRERFDLVHVLWGERDLGIIDLLASRLGVPLIVTFHAPYHDSPHPLRRLSALRNLAGVVLVSSSQLPFFSTLLPGSVLRRVILHGIDIQAFRPAFTAERTGRFVVCYVGSFRRDFGVLEQVIERFQQDPGVEFHLLVPAAVQTRFAQFTHVKFAKGLSDEQLAEFYRQASCLLMTLEDGTANNAVLEALASGLPVVAEDVGGTREYVGSGAARLLPKGDISGLVGALRDLQTDALARQRMGRAARERAEELSWETKAMEMKTFYREVLACRNYARN